MFTDREHRILLSAMRREIDVCKKVDKQIVREPYEETLESVCESINRKIYDIQHKYRWHDLRKNPNDLPIHEKPYLCRIDTMGTYEQKIRTEYVVLGRYQIMNLKEFVIAWRHIEAFEEV